MIWSARPAPVTELHFKGHISRVEAGTSAWFKNISASLEPLHNHYY